MMMDPNERLSWLYELYLLGQQGARDNPETVRQMILQHVVMGFSASSGCLALKDAGPGDLTIVTGVGISPKAIGTAITFGQGVLGQVAQTQAPLLLNGDLSGDQRVKAREGESNRPSSAMCWPLRIEDHLLGTLSINRGEGEEPFSDDDLDHGQMIVNMISVVVENLRLHQEQKMQILEMREMNRKLEDAHNQLFQSEKLASIGQLAAGVAHEINNPVGYINSNLSSLEEYLAGLFKVVEAYRGADGLIAADGALMAAIEQAKKDADLEYLQDDVTDLVAESLEGLDRVKRIVQDLKDFSHVDEAEWEPVDLHRGIDSTLNIVSNEIKYKADVVKEYGELPLVSCLPGQINQVFVNLLVNAAHAIDGHGTITIRTGHDAAAEEVWVTVTDTGQGIDPENLDKLFDPFFTTKPVGTGTGLGLSLSYGIVQRHGGRIEVDSEVGVGTTFTVSIPERRGADIVTPGMATEAIDLFGGGAEL